VSNRTLTLDDQLYDYLLNVSLREPEVLARLRQETRDLPQARMQIAPEQGQFMALLIRMLDARRVLEVGTFTGYSTLIMALALPEDGRIVTCDVSEDWTAVAIRYWQEAGVVHRIDLQLRPALETLRELIDAGNLDLFDFAFIDADKAQYHDYYEAALRLIRPGGVIAIDNTLWGGSVVDMDKTDPDTNAIRAFNTALASDERVNLSLLPIGDGLTLVQKRT